jgi:hypothetical protein
LREKFRDKKKTGRLSAEDWNDLSDTNKDKLKKEHKDAKGAKQATNKKPSKSKDRDDKSTSGESVPLLKKKLVALKKVNKSLKKTAYTLINEGNKSDLLDEDGSNNFLAGVSMICEASPQLAKWHGQQFASAKKKGTLFDLDLSKEVLLDLETTHVLFCNPKLVNNIRDSTQALWMSGNGGMMRITQKSDFPGLFPDHIKPAETWFSPPKAITNLLSFKALNNIYRFTYNSKN